jgi:hypothetical protein
LEAGSHRGRCDSALFLKRVSRCFAEIICYSDIETLVANVIVVGGDRAFASL